MSKDAYNSILAGLADARAFAQGKAGRGKVHRVRVGKVDVKHVRKKLGLSQQGFAELFGVSLRTLQNWEQEHREPKGPARVLLHVIDRKPTAVLEALGHKVKKGA